MILHLTKNQKEIRRRLLKILYEANSSHIGSCLNVIDLIDSIYAIKKSDEMFVLSNGHAAAAHYIILEKHNYMKKPDVKKLGFHPNRNVKYGIDVSTGSLGQGLPIAVGIALANRNKNVYCIISDGECTEGSIWESLRIVHDLHISNVKIIVSANGWGAYGAISAKDLQRRFQGFGFRLVHIDGHSTSTIIRSLKKKHNTPVVYFAKTSSEQLSFLKGNGAHYHIMDRLGYESAMKELL
jgi:transketolase